MSFGGSFFKKRKGQWHYYPFGLAIKDISMPVKDGEKDLFEVALNKEMYFALVLPPIVICLAQVNPYVTLVLLILVPGMIYRRKYMERKYCHFVPYPKFYFFRNYFDIVVPYIDEDMMKKRWGLYLFFVFLLLASIATYMEEGFSASFVFVSFFTVFSTLPFYLIHLKKKSIKKQKSE